MASREHSSQRQGTSGRLWEAHGLSPFLLCRVVAQLPQLRIFEEGVITVKRREDQPVPAIAKALLQKINFRKHGGGAADGSEQRRPLARRQITPGHERGIPLEFGGGNLDRGPRVLQ